MDKLKFRRSGIQARVLALTMFFTLGASLVIAASNMHQMTAEWERTTILNAEYALQTAASAIRRDVDEIDDLAGWCAYNPGMRTYLLVEGGFDVAPYLDSASTFTLGQFGGHGGRTLRVGDVLHIGAPLPHNAETTQPSIAPIEGHHWEIGALSGPHSTAEYIVSGWMQEFFAARWEVHYQSARTGIRNPCAT